MTNPHPVPHIRLRWVLGLTSTAYFMVVLDSLVVITALPQMQRDLHAESCLAAVDGQLLRHRVRRGHHHRRRPR